MATGSNIRVSDVEREAVATQLREHYADGRLTLDELNERIDQVLAAKTRADLGAVTRDLPMSPLPVGSASSWQDATSGSGYSGNSGSYGSSGSYGNSGSGRRMAMAAALPLIGMFWVFVLLGSLFAFGFGGGSRPLAIVFFLAALAFLRRLFGGRRRRGNGGHGRCRRFRR